MYAVPGKEPEESCLMQVLLYFIAEGLTKCIPSALGGALKGADDLKVLAAMPLLRKPYDMALIYTYQIVFLWTCKPVESLTCKCSRSVGSMWLFVKKHLHALLACDNAVCNKSGENSRADFTELFYSASDHHNLSRVSSEHLFPGHIKLFICGQGMKVMGV